MRTALGIILIAFAASALLGAVPVAVLAGKAASRPGGNGTVLAAVAVGALITAGALATAGAELISG